MLSLSYFDSLCGRSHCGYRSDYLWWVSLLRDVVALYFPAQIALFLIPIWMCLLVSDPRAMATPSSSPSKPPPPKVVLPTSAAGPPSPLTLNEPGSSRPSKPSSSTMATFSEALILGSGGHRSASATNAPTHLPPVSGVTQILVSVPSDSLNHSLPASMHNLCLLGKPWGEAIRFPIVMSKTRKDWGFVKG